MVMGGFRYANIGLAVGISIMAVGVILFKDSSQAAMQAVGMVGFFASFVVFHFLDERAKRRDKDRAQ
jgi:hypothetical protein